MDLPEQTLGGAAMLSLAVFSAVAGVLILWVFKVTSHQKALKATRRRLKAYVLAMRLFGDDPGMVLRSQGRLLLWNFRYLALLLPPFVAIAIPMYLLWDHLEALYARAPFQPGQVAVVTAKIRGPLPPVHLAAPDWMAVETPPVRVLAENEVSWRVRVRRPGSGVLRVEFPGAAVEKRVEAQPGLHYLRDRQSYSGPAEWVELRYPPANLRLLGITTNWIVWFCVISTAAALLFRRRLRVTM